MVKRKEFSLQTISEGSSDLRCLCSHMCSALESRINDTDGKEHNIIADHTAFVNVLCLGCS